MSNKIITPLKAQFQLQTSLLVNVLANISDEEANLNTNEDLSTIVWISGHIVNTRITLLNILTGKGDDAEFSKLFGKGTSKNKVLVFPKISEILEKLNYVTSELLISFENVTDEFLNSKAPFQTSIPDATNLGLIAFLFLHEANHCGQISMLRKFYKNQFETDIALYDKVICN